MSSTARRRHDKDHWVPEFPDRLRAARTAHGWSQQYLAELAGFHQSAIGHFEAPINSEHNRTPTLANLKCLALVLRVSANYLLGLPSEGNDLDHLPAKP